MRAWAATLLAEQAMGEVTDAAGQTGKALVEDANTSDFYTNLRNEVEGIVREGILRHLAPPGAEPLKLARPVAAEVEADSEVGRILQAYRMIAEGVAIIAAMPEGESVNGESPDIVAERFREVLREHLELAAGQILCDRFTEGGRSVAA